MTNIPDFERLAARAAHDAPEHVQVTGTVMTRIRSARDRRVSAVPDRVVLACAGVSVAVALIVAFVSLPSWNGVTDPLAELLRSMDMSLQ